MPRRYPRPRFSLRALFALVTICACACSLLPDIIARFDSWWNPPFQFTSDMDMPFFHGSDPLLTPVP